MFGLKQTMLTLHIIRFTRHFHWLSYLGGNSATIILFCICLGESVHVRRQLISYVCIAIYLWFISCVTRRGRFFIIWRILKVHE